MKSITPNNERKNGAILSYVAIFANVGIQCVYMPILIRMLGQSEYGVYSLASSLIGYLSILDLGLGNAIIVFASKYKAQKDRESENKLYGTALVLYSIIGLIALILGVILLSSASHLFGASLSSEELQKVELIMLLSIFNIAMSFPFSLYASIISVYEKFTFQKTLSILSSALKPLIMIPILFLGGKSISLTLVMFVVNLLVISSNYAYCRNRLHIHIKPSLFDNKLICIVLGYSFFIFLGSIVDKINWSVDNFILGAVSGTIAVSIYATASQLNNLFISLSTALSGILLPKMSKMIAGNASPKELTEEMIKVGRLQCYIIFLMASSLILFGKNFITLWAGSEYAQSYYVAMLLIIPLCFPLIQNLGLSIMQAMNKYRFKAISTLIMAVFNVIISCFLAKSFGPIGAAAGTAIAIIACNIILINLYYVFALKLDMLLFWRRIFQMIVPFILPICSILIFMHFVRLSGLIALVIYGGIYVTMYAATAYFLSMNKYEKGIIDKIIRRKR